MLDETKGTGQDTSSGDAGQSSGSKGGSTSKGKGKTYTDAEIAKIKSDAAAEAGRQRKAAEQERDSIRQQLQSATSRLDELERERDEARLAEARGDPDSLRNYQREQELKRLDRELKALKQDIETREAQLKADREDVDKDKRFVSVAYIAAKHGLTTDELESFGISDTEALERVAERIASASSKETETEAKGGEGEGGAEEGTLILDSGEGTGVSEPTVEQLDKMSMEKYAAARKKQDSTFL